MTPQRRDYPVWLTPQRLSLCFKNRTLAVFSLPQCQTRSSCLFQVRYSESEHYYLARRPRLASGTWPSRYAVSQPVHRDLFVHGIQGSITAPYEVPTFSQWDPAISLSHALWHCPQGISFSHALALSTSRPRLASGTRPSRSAVRNPSIVTLRPRHSGSDHRSLDEASCLSLPHSGKASHPSLLRSGDVPGSNRLQVATHAGPGSNRLQVATTGL